MKIIKQKFNAEALVERLLQGNERIGARILFRASELDVLQLALLVGQHVMLDGPPGTAKSMLAQSVFSLIEGGQVFKLRLDKGVQPDNVIGPLSMAEYRKGRIHYLTEGRFPKAHFAFLDEIYWAPENLLPTMLGILNEREFINGDKVEQCPLITAVATTNFVVEDNVLEAFRDRWLFRLYVTGTSSASKLIDLLQVFDETLTKDLKAPKAEVEDPLSLAELMYLQERISEQKVPSELVQNFADLVSVFRLRFAGVSGIQFSDRRACLAFVVLKALCFLADISGAETSPAILYNLRPVFDVGTNSVAHESFPTDLDAFMTVHIQGFEKAILEKQQFTEFMSVEEAIGPRIDRFTRFVSENRLTKKLAQKYMRLFKECIGTLEDPSDQFVFSMPVYQKEVSKLVTRLNECTGMIEEKFPPVPQMAVSSDNPPSSDEPEDSASM